MLYGLAGAWGRQIVEARGDRPFASMDDFARRTGFGRAVIVRLAKAGVFGSLAMDRRQSLWHALEQDQKEMPLFDAANTSSPPAFRLPPSPLPPMLPVEEVLADYSTTGLSLRAHPLEFLRAELDRLGVTPAAGLKTAPSDTPVRVAGLVLVRQRPSTAKGITFVTLEDETGTVNLIVRPGVWRRYRTAAIGATVLMADGQLQRGQGNIHVLVTRLEDVSVRLDGMGSQSRDFC